MPLEAVYQFGPHSAVFFLLVRAGPDKNVLYELIDHAPASFGSLRMKFEPDDCKAHADVLTRLPFWVTVKPFKDWTLFSGVFRQLPENWKLAKTQ